MKYISIALLFTLLSQSCTVYKVKSVALEDAYDKGKVKLYLVDGSKLKFKNLITKQGDTYGQVKEKLKDESGKKIPNYEKLSAEIKSIHLKNEALSIIIPVLVIAGSMFVAFLISPMVTLYSL